MKTFSYRARRLGVAVGVGSALGAVVPTATAVSAEEVEPQPDGVEGVEGVDYVNPDRPYCLTTAFSAEEIEAGVDTTMTTAACFATEAEVELAAVSLNTRSMVQSGAVPEAAASSFSYQAIAMHCDGYCHIGASPKLTINGTDCNGGGLTFAAAWKNVFNENQHKKCEHIKHYALDNCGGTAESDTGDYNDYSKIFELEDDSNSAKYYGPEN
jgi:hypothetical protein